MNFSKNNRKTSFLAVLFLFLFNFSYSNSVVVSNLALNGQNTTSDFTLINFDIAWSNSWRTNVGPSNWDAAWVFAKFRKKYSTVWSHATLNWVNGTGAADGHTIPTGATISSGNDDGANGAHGVFIYSTGTITQQGVNYTGAKLRWNYGVDGVLDADSVEICVFAIEMVYSPAGSFYVGDGNGTIIGQLRQQATNVPFQITSEAALTLGGGGATSLLNNNTTGMSTPDDFNNSTSQNLPAAFPKGFAAFYVMKYEVSQEQYVEFLNKLSRTQQAQRFAATTVGNFMHSGGAAATPQNRNGVKLISDPGGLSSRIYGNDFNNNATAGEAGDGQNTACNWMSSGDLLAYLDWAALRPMTELEYEKAGRGSNSSVAGGYSWESTSILGATGITNSGQNSEIASNAGSNCVYNNAGGVPGPMRVGNFAQAATSQLQAGASYIGVLDLTGNVWEDVVLIGSNAGRSFTGLHGNGVLNSNGQADVNFWPGINGNATPGTANAVYGGVTGCTGYAGISFTGGSWQEALYLTLSDRQYRGTGWNGISGRDTRNGGRGARLAP